MDMLRATEEFLVREGIPYAPDLFLFGYSQGGHTTMAIQQELEARPLSSFSLRAVAAGAGAFNPERVLGSIVAQETYPAPAFLAGLTYAYETTYQLEGTLNAYFNEPYAAQVPSLFDGSLSRSGIEALLPERLDELFQADFLNELRSTEPSAFRSKLAENRVDDFNPTVPMLLFHSRADEYVPFSDTEATFARFEQQGVNITFSTAERPSHEEAVLDMIEAAVPWFEQFYPEL
jgi:fermentation-respiration switch protein FrsA (DUF1100 family)